MISIGGENNHVATTPSLTLKSVRSGRNVLIVCSVLVVLTGPFLFQAIVILMEWKDLLPSWYLFGATWMYVSNTFVNSFVYIIVFRSGVSIYGFTFAWTRLNIIFIDNTRYRHLSSVCMKHTIIFRFIAASSAVLRHSYVNN